MDESDNEEWYIGFVVAYNSAKQLHEIAYEDEDDHCHFNLMEDLKAGDLKVRQHWNNIIIMFFQLLLLTDITVYEMKTILL
jgi:hypothetical protein